MEKVSFIFVPYPTRSFLMAKAKQKAFTVSGLKLTLKEARDYSAMQIHLL